MTYSQVEQSVRLLKAGWKPVSEGHMGPGDVVKEWTSPDGKTYLYEDAVIEQQKREVESAN